VTDVAAALAAFATAERATSWCWAREPPQAWLTELVRGSPVASVLRHPRVGRRARDRQSSDESPSRAPSIVRSVSALPWRRKAWGWAVAVVTLPLLTALLIPHREDLSLSTILVLYLVVVVVIAAIGGLVVGLVSRSPRSCSRTGSSHRHCTR
jgi:two-component system sensor histidine kinase KdpD